MNNKLSLSDDDYDKSISKNSLYITNIHPNTEKLFLKDILERYGQVIRFVFEERCTQNRKYFVSNVSYRNEKQCQIAKEALNGLRLFSWEISVTYKISKINLVPFAKVSFNNLSNEISFKKLKKAINKYAEPITLVILRENDGTSLGSAYAVFWSLETARTVANQMRARPFQPGLNTIVYKADGTKDVHQKRQTGKRKRIMDNDVVDDGKFQLNTIKIKSLSPIATKSVLEMIFNKYGGINQIVLLEDQGIAVIEFFEVESCFKALSKFETDQDLIMIFDDSKTAIEDIVTIATKKEVKEIINAKENRREKHSYTKKLLLLEELSTSDSQKEKNHNESVFSISQNNSKENLIRSSSFFSEQAEEKNGDLTDFIEEFSKLSLLNS